MHQLQDPDSTPRIVVEPCVMKILYIVPAVSSISIHPPFVVSEEYTFTVLVALEAKCTSVLLAVKPVFGFPGLEVPTPSLPLVKK